MTLGAKVKYVGMEFIAGGILRERNVSVPAICRWELENRSAQAMTRGKFSNYCEKSGIVFKDAQKYGGGA